jgi:hypothetical protein
VDGLDAAERAVTNLQSRPMGKIKMTAPATYAEKHILPLVNDFVQQSITINTVNSIGQCNTLSLW